MIYMMEKGGNPSLFSYLVNPVNPVNSLLASGISRVCLLHSLDHNHLRFSRRLS
jgi:hypothetical protein